MFSVTAYMYVNEISSSQAFFFFFGLQETALNHVKTAGLLGDGFGSTPEMCKKNLIWVVTRMQVEIDRYPTW